MPQQARYGNLLLAMLGARLRATQGPDDATGILLSLIPRMHSSAFQRLKSEGLCSGDNHSI